MNIEDRLVVEKKQVEARKEQMRLEKEKEELAKNKEKPFVRQSSLALGLKKQSTLKQSKGLDQSTNKWD